MEGKLKKIAGSLVTLLLTVSVVCGLGYIVRPVKTDIALDAINVFHEMPMNTIEVIGYGSSHMWRGLDPRVMYENYGIGAYNYGCNWQNINTTDLFFRDSLLTQSPKVILIETYKINSILKDTNMNGEIYYTRNIKRSDVKTNYLRQCFGDDKERYLSYYMPLCAFHDNWINIEEESFNRIYNRDTLFKTKGYVSVDNTEPVVIYDSESFEQSELSEESLEILDNIVATCKEKNISIIFYTAPYQGVYNYSKAMKEYAELNNCVYFDLFEYVEELNIDGETDFSDIDHLNDSGTAKVSNFLSEYIVNNYDVTDMRDIKNNLWE